MKNKLIFCILLFTIVFTLCELNNNRLHAQNENDEVKLIEIGLTTEQSHTESDDGSFSAEILAKNGNVVAIYNCRKNVEKILKDWAKNNKVKLVEKKSDEKELHYAYASENPKGYFILDMKYSSSMQNVKITFWYRSLSNERISGDQMGLEPLGDKLLQALQCVPN